MTASADPAASSTTVLFDLDGTITDSFDGIAASFRHALAHIGAPDPDGAVVAGIAGPPMQDTFRTLGLDDDAIAAAMTAYRARYTDIGWRENAVFPGMDVLVRDLRASGRRMAVSTSKNENTARRILEHFGLADCFDVIAGASDDGTRRSKSDVVAHALASLGIEANGSAVTDVVIVGDRSHDVHGAGEFGIPAVFVEWGYSLPGEVDDAAWSVQTVPDLRAVLGLSPVTTPGASA